MNAQNQQYRFLMWKPEIFRHSKAIKDKRGGVVFYATQVISQINVDVVEQRGCSTVQNKLTYRKEKPRFARIEAFVFNYADF
jgi:hypothetical protein